MEQLNDILRQNNISRENNTHCQPSNEGSVQPNNRSGRSNEGSVQPNNRTGLSNEGSVQPNDRTGRSNEGLPHPNDRAGQFDRRTRAFRNPMTQYDPSYRSVQQELWQLLNREQQAMVANHFSHLKNHAQVAIAEALIDYIEEGILPDFSEAEFLYAATFVKLTGYGLVPPNPTDIRPMQETDIRPNPTDIRPMQENDMHSL